MKWNRKELSDRIRKAFSAIAYVAAHYHQIDPEHEDADDFVETMIVAESLLSCGGLNHRDLVTRLHLGRPTRIGHEQIRAGGNRNSQSQIGKLRRSGNPYYLATDGSTNGAAMHTMPVALFYPGFEEVVYAADFIARITHSSEKSRMAAVMMTLAYRLNLMDGNWWMATLRDLLREAAKLLGMESTGEYFCDLLWKGSTSVMPGQTTYVDLATQIGFKHAAISSPIAAVIAARNTNMVYDFLANPPKKSHSIIGVPDDLFTQNRDLHHEESDDERAYADRHDADTFYSMATSLAALASEKNREHGMSDAFETNAIYERFDNIADAFAARWPYAME